MSSTLVTPLLIAQPFGFGAANPTYINIPIPVPSQISTTVNAASFTDGFPPNTMTPEASGGLPFFGQDMNGILYMVSAYCANFAAGALSKYSSTLAGNISGYPPGVVLAAANNTHLWLNTTDGNTSDPDASGAGWVPIACTGEFVLTLSTGTYTLTNAQAAAPIIAFNGTLTGNCTVNFPQNVGQQWIVAAYTSGAFNITLQTVTAGNQVSLVSAGSGGGYANAQNVFVDSGGSLWSNNISTAGLAPINSPVLTGTPTAPTASPATTNNTQIATTAFAQAAITAALALYAKLASPIFSGTPTAPTPTFGDNTLKLATTAFVQAAAGNSAVVNVNGGLNFANGIQIRWGIVNHSVGGNQTHAFSTPFTTACFVVIPVVASSTGVEFFTYLSSTNSGWTQYSNNTTLINYIAIGY